MSKKLPRVSDRKLAKLKDILELDKYPSKVLLDQYISQLFDVAPLVLEPASIKISATSSGTVISHKDGCRICVYAMAFTVCTAGTVRWDSGSTAIVASMNFAHEGGMTISVNPPAWLLRCVKDEDLKVVLVLLRVLLSVRWF